MTASLRRALRSGIQGARSFAPRDLRSDRAELQRRAQSSTTERVNDGAIGQITTVAALGKIGK